jgi:predicted dehydrogenase
VESSRRIFLGKVASGLGSFAAVPVRVWGANDRIRVGFIGFGGRASELLHYTRSCANTEAVAFSDIYTRQLERAKALAPGAAVHSDHRQMLEDSSIDAVMIATPQHLHARHFCDALSAGKHVYQERTMALTLDHAKAMRAAWMHDAGRHTVQIGHQGCSSGHMRDAQMFLSDPGRVGKIASIEMRAFRSPRPRPMPDVNATDVAWAAFLDETASGEFDANRFVNWRHYWDYSGGSIYEQMSQQLAFWYKALRLTIPESATAAGGTFVSRDGREVPDTVNVALAQAEQMLINWTSGSGSNHPGAGEMVLGSNGAIVREAQLRFVPQKASRADTNEMTGRSSHVPHAHVQNFFESIRSGREPNCPFELGWRVSIASRMAVEAYRQRRTVRWDATTEEIV